MTDKKSDTIYMYFWYNLDAFLMQFRCNLILILIQSRCDLDVIQMKYANMKLRCNLDATQIQLRSRDQKLFNRLNVRLID